MIVLLTGSSTDGFSFKSSETIARTCLRSGCPSTCFRFIANKSTQPMAESIVALNRALDSFTVSAKLHDNATLAE
jgi:hypothetical protein